MIGITTLEEYFSWLKTLGAINRKYTVLPVGEHYFDINANTRGINIPVDFKKNGVAVQSDDLAEVLYFRIDRYFDYMDLNNTDIFIQWETPKGPDGKTVKSVSPAYIRDIESEPGKLIFGWAISDLITAYAGQLKFSIRFFQWENPELAAQEGADKVLAYSFSTLTATVDIKPSINLNLEKDKYVVDDCGDRLIERLENSVIAGGYAAAIPEFIVDIADTANGYDLDAEGTYELLVQAMASDTGAISYIWKRQDLNEDNSTANAEIRTIDSSNKFVPVEDMNNLNPAYAYYRVNHDGIATLYRGNIPPVEADGLAENEVLYTKQSVCIADNYGEYWAVAENRITNSVEHNESKRAKFPRPEEVTIVADPTPKAILEDKDGELQIGLAVAASNTDGKLSFQWYKDTNKDLNFGGIAPNFVAMEGETAAALTVKEEGHYKVEVTNTRNKDSKSKISEISRVTKAAEIPVIFEQTTAEMKFDIDALTDENCPKILLDSDVYSDFYTVKWFKNDGDKLIHTETLEKGIYISAFNPLNYFETNEEGEYNLDEVLGDYYVIVINNVNGDPSRETSKPTDVDYMFNITI